VLTYIATWIRNWRHIPNEMIVLDEDMFNEFVTEMEKNGFWTADAWYYNHERNKKYIGANAKNDGNLKMPVLFVHAKYDTVCATDNNPKICMSCSHS
jgi:soluble epoxide hydrolase / lipid-phosphate phosphatase